MFRFPGLFAPFFTVIAITAGATAARAAQEDSWFSVTPIVGLRHIGLDVTRNVDGTTGNIGNEIGDSFFFALSLETLEFSFNDSPWGFTLYGYAANVDLSEQWVADGGTNANGTDGGNRQDVGTRISGYYSYLVPTLHFSTQDKKGNGFKAALGYGPWHGNFSGDIILTPDNRPAAGMTKTHVDLNERKWAYLFLMQFSFESKWTWFMSVGGPSWESAGFKYELEEVTMGLGYRFSF
jgi:hypothetical protein